VEGYIRIGIAIRNCILAKKTVAILKGLSFNARLSYDNFFNTNGPDINENGVVFMYVNPQNPTDTTFTLPEGAEDLTNNYDFVRRPFNTGTEGAQSNVVRILDYQASINYARRFGKHDISALALLQRRQRSSGANFPNYREDWVGRVTYNYDTRYFLEVNGAYNGSEKFAREYRFGFFPSYAVGWLVSNENFFKNNVPFLTHLKLRYSYGTVGSDEGIDRWQYVGGYALTNRNSQFGWPNLQNNFQIYEEDIIANPDIRWETAVKQNLGIETSWLNGLISVNFDYYWDHRTNIFMSANQRNVPVFFGADPVAANLGETKTYGWELEASIRKMYANGFNFFIRANYNHAIDQIIFREDPELAPDYLK
ncbi:MAG: SusC/RagA family TonB-linked outer membrane protein, partial [Bacteroidota bacterium]